MDESVENLEELENAELYQKAKALGIRCGGVTKTTRRIVINQIRKKQNTENKVSCLPMPHFLVKADTECEKNFDDDLRRSMTNLSLQSTPVSTNSSKSTKYYGVSSPDQFSVVSSLKEVKELAKTCPSLRFKLFDSFEEASSYLTSFQESRIMENESSVETGSKDASDSHDQSPGVSGELPLFRRWKSPSTKAIAKFRGFVENNDCKQILVYCTDNPRYLVSSVDTPVVLHHGARRNAFHICAQNNHSDVIKILLSLLYNDMWGRASFFEPNSDGLTSQNNSSINNFSMNMMKFSHYKDCMQHVTDLYLNTPDKIIFDTPLHIACKYGSTDVVKLLLQQPKIFKHQRNKFGEEPFDVICSRYNQSDTNTVTEIIEQLFNEP